MLCLATAIHNLKWFQITRICLILDQSLKSIDVETVISFPIAMILMANKNGFKKIIVVLNRQRVNIEF